MEFIDPKYKQKHQKRLFFDYFILGLVISLATYLLVATSLGYSLFQFNGQLLQNSFLYVDSTPVKAQVYINNKLEENRADVRLKLIEGDYEVTLKADGYKDWTKRVLLEGGEVKFVNYPKLIPNKLNTTDVKSFTSNLSGLITQSPDKKWLIMQTEATKPELQVLDMQSKENTIKTIILSKEVLVSKTDTSGNLSLIEWSNDNRHFIAKEIAADGKVNFILVDIDNVSSSINLNSHFGINPARVAFKDKKFDKYYFYFVDGGQIKTADLKNKTVSDSLVDQVLDFSVESDSQIIYATTKGASSGKVMTGLYRNEKTYNIAEVLFDAESKYFLKAGNYEGNWYYLVGSKSSEIVQVFKNIDSQINDDKNSNKSALFTVMRPGGLIKTANIAFDNRFILAQSGQNFSIYDLETKLPYKYTISQPIDNDYSVTWMDGFRIMYRSNKILNVMEFDGKNNQELIVARDGLPIIFDKDYFRLYGFNNSDKALVLQATALTVEKQ